MSRRLGMHTYARAWRLATAMGVIGAALVLASCGGSSDEDSGRAERQHPGIVPTKAAVIATVDLRRSSDHGIGRARGVLGRIPAWRFVDQQILTPDDVVQQLAAANVVPRSVTWRRDVEPWLGAEGGAAAWVNLGDHGATAVGGIAWLDSSNDDRAAAAAARAFGGASSSGKRGGVAMHRGQLEDGSEIDWAVYAGRLVVASDRRALEASIDAAGGTSYEDRGPWRLLTEPRRVNQGTTIARLVLTKALFTRDALDRVADANVDARELVDGLRRLPGAEVVEDQSIDGIALQFGASSRGLWFDGVVAGELPVATADVGAMDVLGRLPVNTVAGIATSASGGPVTDATVEIARAQASAMLRSATEASGDADGGDRALAGSIAQALGPLLSDRSIENMRTGWGDTAAAGMVLDRGAPALVAAVDVDDPAAADEAMNSLIGAVGTIVEGVAPPVRVTATTGSEGAIRVVGVSRSALGAWLQTAARRDPRVATHPAVEQLLAPSLDGSWTTSDEAQVLALPSSGLSAVDRSWNDDRDTLASAGSIGELGAAAKIPDDAPLVWWIDTARIGGAIADGVGGRFGAVAKAQLAGIGGPIGWVEARRQDDTTVERVALELAIDR